MNDCLRFTPVAENAGNTYTITCAVKDKITWKTLTYKTMTLNILPNTVLSGKTVVFIGDSLTNAGYYPYEIQHNLSNNGVISVGTRTSRPTFDGETVTINHEGRGGWSPVDYISRASWGDDVNAFWNPTTNKFDFAYWMSNNNFTMPDLVFINLGTNGAGNYSANLDAIDEILLSVRASSPNVPVLISLITPPATQDGWDYVVPGGSAAQFAVQQITYNKACMARFGSRESEHIYLSPVYFNLDRYHDYPTEEVAVSARNPEIVTIQTNNIHPSKYGYFKFADVYWGMIQKLLN
jgi:lysophospholipase L1-like esterase